MTTAVVDGTFATTNLHAVYALQRSEIRPPHVIALAELPQVGPHATGIGKLAASLPLPFELRTYGWQLQRGDRKTAADQVRAISHRNSVIQALADVAQTEPIGDVSIALLGPVALSVSGMLPTGQRILRDPGARAEIAAAWVDGVAGLVTHIRQALGAETTIFVQEHDAADAVNGRIRSVSGADVERAVDIAEVRGMWEPLAALDATVLLDTHPELVATAAEVGSVVIDWPRGRSAASEQTWQLIDRFVGAEQPVGLRLRPHGVAERVAEDLMDEYRDWGLDPDGVEHMRFVCHFDQDPETTVGTGLQWLRDVTEHANGYIEAG